MKKVDRMKNVKFRRNSVVKDEFQGKILQLNSAVKTQISRIGSKFRGLPKTVGPTDKIAR